MPQTEEELSKENDVLSNLIHDKVKELSKYFDSVQIFCTKHENDKVGTTHFMDCSGNFYARYGQIQLWTKKQTLIDNNDQ